MLVRKRLLVPAALLVVMLTGAISAVTDRSGTAAPAVPSSPGVLASDDRDDNPWE